MDLSGARKLRETHPMHGTAAQPEVEDCEIVPSRRVQNRGLALEAVALALHRLVDGALGGEPAVSVSRAHRAKALARQQRVVRFLKSQRGERKCDRPDRSSTALAQMRRRRCPAD